MAKQVNPLKQARKAVRKVGDAVLDLIASVPGTNELESATPAAKARVIRRAASTRALAAAGALALPPGPWGWLTIIPELHAVWRIQAQMVADIAAVYGKSATLSKEQIAYCLFKHTAAQALREIVAQVGERFLVQKASVRALRAIASQVGIHVSQRSLTRVVSRWIPILGAVGVGAYAYYDTGRVATTAIEFFGADIELLESTPASNAPRRLATKSAPTAKPRKRRAAAKAVSK